MFDNIFAFDEPFEYGDIKIYPILVKDFFLFSYAVDCLLIDKNSIPDAKIISMSYLDFLISSNSENNGNLDRLAILFHITMKINPEDILIYKDEKEHHILKIKSKNISITSLDFEKIKEVILKQNLIEEPDYTIQKEIRDKIEEGKKIKNKSFKSASMEDQIVSLSVSTGISLDSIYNMTYRKFIKSISRADLLLHYKIYLQSSMSGFVTFKNPSSIKHWLSDINEIGKDGFMDVGDMSKKLSFEDKK